MTYKQDRLREVATRMAALRDTAAQEGRAMDADDLAVASAALWICVDNFGMASSELRHAEDPADAARARSSLIEHMRPVGDPVKDQECCPYSKDGLCRDCRVFAAVFEIEGSQRRFICFTRWAKGSYQKQF